MSISHIALIVNMVQLNFNGELQFSMNINI